MELVQAFALEIVIELCVSFTKMVIHSKKNCFLDGIYLILIYKNVTFKQLSKYQNFTEFVGWPRMSNYWSDL